MLGVLIARASAQPLEAFLRDRIFDPLGMSDPARVDVPEPTAQFTILPWLACCAGFGFASPRRPWRWAALVSPWLPLLYLTLGLVRSLPFGKAFSYTDLLLFPVALGVCLMGAYIGALARRIALPPSPSVETLA